MTPSGASRLRNASRLPSPATLAAIVREYGGTDPDGVAAELGVALVAAETGEVRPWTSLLVRLTSVPVEADALAS